MVGNWIKMKATLPDSPEVAYIAMKTKLDADSVVGKLMRLWVWTDTHCTEDGRAVGITSKWINDFVHAKGFSEAMTDEPCGWLEIDEHGVTFVNYSAHNGNTAKTRSINQKRKQEYRSGTNVPTLSQHKRDKSRTDSSHLSQSQEDISGTKKGPQRESKNKSNINTPQTPLEGGLDSADTGTDPAPKRQRRKPTGIHAELNEYYISRWQEKYGNPYPFRQRDGVHSAELLTLCGGSLEDAKAVLDRYLNTTGEFFNGHPLGKMIAQVATFMTSGPQRELDPMHPDYQRPWTDEDDKDIPDFGREAEVEQ